MTMYLANGTNTTNATEATSYVYHITMKKLIDGTSVSNIGSISKTSATIAVELPTAVMTSTAPLSGSYRITCPDPVGNDVAADPYTTTDIPLTQSSRWIAQSIFKNCSGTYDKLEVWNANTFSYK